jgi:hypothetical protein
MKKTPLLLGCLAVLFALMACSSDGGNGDPTPVPDFELLDVNPASPTYDTLVSPRDEIGHITGWYWGSAT